NNEGRPGTNRVTRWRKSNPSRHKHKLIKADPNQGRAYTSHLNKSYKAKKPKEMLNHKHDEKSGYQCSKVKEENRQQFFESFWGNGENFKKRVSMPFHKKIYSQSPKSQRNKMESTMEAVQL
uniref:Uncharacterized protein n=1 Tax=Romanomermis culicivorax TaxID=13658 RepID=A0A915JDW8_ROMCU